MIRYVPELKNFPTEFIYTPWEAPENVQEEAGCIIGKDYPAPIVDHDVAVQRNRQVSHLARLTLRTGLLYNLLFDSPWFWKYNPTLQR